MFDDLPPDLERLQTLRTWHLLWVRRIDAKIEALLKRQAEAERGRRERPLPPEWIVELGIGTGRPPVQVHAGDCHMTGKRRRPVSRDEARRLLATGLRACTHCAPDAQLNILDLPASRPAPGRLRAAIEQSCHVARYPAERAMCTNRLEQDLPDDHSPAPDQRARSLRPGLPRRQGRPLRRLPAQDPQIRLRR